MTEENLVPLSSKTQNGCTTVCLHEVKMFTIGELKKMHSKLYHFSTDRPFTCSDVGDRGSAQKKPARSANGLGIMPRDRTVSLQISMAFLRLAAW